MKIKIIGNCQADLYSRIFNFLSKDVSSQYQSISSVSDGLNFDLFDFVLVQKHPMLGKFFCHADNPKFVPVPNLTLSGYFPDIIYLDPQTAGLGLGAQSNIVTNACLHGFSEEECFDLFNKHFMSLLGYPARYSAAQIWLVDQLNNAGLDGDFLVGKWELKAPFLLSPKHPETFVLQDIVRGLAEKIGISLPNVDLELVWNNEMRGGSIFPWFGPSKNSLTCRDQFYRIAGKLHTLREFIAISYEALEREFSGQSLEQNKSKLPEGRYDDFSKALKDYNATPATARASNPYRTVREEGFWRKSVANLEPKCVSPIVFSAPLINAQTKVATAGSCFAQHIAKTLSRQGLNYFVAEPAPPEMSSDEAEALGYNLFSARYGNIYTPRQLLQLFLRAYGRFEHHDEVWLSKSGNFIDPFRPNIGQEFDSIDNLIKDRATHYSSVRSMFENMDVFIFTLGLTEAWVNINDGSVFPVAPGVVSQHNDYSSYGFRNFTKEEIQEDLINFISNLRCVNRNAKILLTVSPVPLVATYDNDHVLSATTYSKSVLRAAAGDVSNSFEFVNYFPSYEIITGNFNRGAYFMEDLRSVRQDGVDHVMRVFTEFLIENDTQVREEVTAQYVDPRFVEEMHNGARTVCDEDLIDDDLANDE
jgi:GSCFA family